MPIPGLKVVSGHKAGRSLPRKVTTGFFDARPIDLGGFRLRSRSIVVVGKPTDAQWSAAFEFACNTEEASPYWIGDLLAYADSRADWREKIDQAKAVTGMAEQTLHNLGYVSRRIKETERQISQTISHAKVVAKLSSEDQNEWLTKSRDEGWTAAELGRNIVSANRSKVIEGQAVLAGMYRVIYADPPWLYGNKPPSGSGAQNHYAGMTIEDLCKLPVQAHALKHSVLFMWVTAPMLYENPGPREVIEAWGFKPKTGRVWDKVNHNFGSYVSVRHEHLIIATRGSCTPDRTTPMLDSVVTERNEGEHSEKPESFRKDVERMYDGPYLELFGRKKVDGWDVFGNDAKLWAEEAAV